MEVTCEKQVLFSAVEAVERVTSIKSTIPIIGNFLMEATKEGMRLSANNLEMAMEVMVPARVKKEGAILVQAKTMAGIVSKLPEDSSVTISVSDQKQVHLSFKESKFQLYGLPPDEFPSLPKLKDTKSISIDRGVLEQMIRQTVFAASTSEDRYVLNGVLLILGSGFARMVATDGFRLAKSEVTLDGKDEVDGSYVVPGKVLTELARVIHVSKGIVEKSEVKLSVSPDQIAFRYGDYYLVSRLIQGQFPDYKQVIPKSSEVHVSLKTHEFIEATERAAIIAQAASNIVRLELVGNKLHVGASVPEVGDVDEVLDVTVKGDKRVRASFSTRLLLDVLKAMPTEEVVLELSGPLDPGVFRPAGSIDYLHIIMPIRTAETVPVA